MDSSYRPSLENNHIFAPVKTEGTMVHSYFADQQFVLLVHDYSQFVYPRRCVRSRSR